MALPVFKTGEVEQLGLAGSIPVRLRETVRAEVRDDGGCTPERSPDGCRPRRRPAGRGDDPAGPIDGQGGGRRCAAASAPWGIGSRRGRGCRRGRIAGDGDVPPRGDQRDGGGPAHEPRPGSTVRCGAAGDRGSSRLRRYRVRPCHRPAGAARTRHPGDASSRGSVRRGRTCRQQRRRGDAARDDGARGGPGGRGQPGRAGGDRRWVPAARSDRIDGCPAARGRHHEPGSARRLRRCDWPGYRLHPQGASEQLSHRGLHRLGPDPRAW